jgi:hypothetical protein
MAASSASFPRRKEEEEEEEDAHYEDEEFAPMDASSPRSGERGREQQKDEENAKTAASENNNKSNMGSRKSSALEELNQDGYFGSADGNWIEDDAAPLVLMQKSNTMDAPTLKEDMRELWRFYGKKIVVSALAVGILIASIAIVSMQTSERSPNSSSDMYKKSPWAGFDVSPAELRWYWGYKWERIPSECAMPEAPYETDDIAFSDEDGNEIDDILGKREGNRVNGMVEGISPDEEAMFAGTERSRRRALDMIFSNEKRCPLETIQCGFSGAVSVKMQSFGTCAIVGPAIYKGMNMGPKIDQHDTVIRLASMPNEKFKNDLGAKTSVIYATGEQTNADDSYTPFGPVNSKTAVRDGWVPDKFWIVEDEKHQEGELDGVNAHDGKPVLWVNRPFPSATKRNYDSDLQTFDFRFFVNRVLAAAHEKEDMSEAWFTLGADDDIPDTYKTQDHYALLFNVMFSGLCESIHVYGFGYRPLNADDEASAVPQAYYDDNPATKAHFALLSDSWNTAKRDALLAKALMTNNTICSYGAS